jgi:hypothetical protein
MNKSFEHWDIDLYAHSRRALAMRRTYNTPERVKILCVFAAISALFLLTSCPTPIDEEIVKQKRDEGAPAVTILSPSDGSYYTELVTVEGKISDDSAASNEAGEITSLAYEVIGPLGVLKKSDLKHDEQGYFSFQFATASIDGSAVVKITAVDWNGNTGVHSITLKDPGNDIPSFHVEPGNKHVAMSWNAVPDAESYTVHYTTNGTPPSINYGIKVQNITSARSPDSPLIIENLENGNMHVFLLQAHSQNPGDIWLSDNVKAIPLSPLSLAPVVTGEFNQIRVEWSSIEATEYFEVLRSTQRDGDYENISGTIEETMLIDNAVEAGMNYFYKIQPSFTGAIQSDANCDKSSPFTFTEGIELIDYYPFTIAPAGAVAVKGQYAYLVDYSGYLYKINIGSVYKPFVEEQIQLNAGFPPGDIAVDDNYVYVGFKFNGGFYVLDVNTLEIKWQFFGSAYGIDQDATHVYVAFYTSGPMGQPGLYRFDKTSFIPESLFAPLITFATDVAVDDTHAYVSDRTGTLHFISKASYMEDLNLPVGVEAYRVSATDNYACVTGLYDRLVVVNLGDYSMKEFPGYLNASDVTAVGSYAYVTDMNGGLLLINLFPDVPVLTAFSPTPPIAEAVAVSGKYAYIANYISGLSIIDVSTSIPDNPDVKSTFAAGDARAVTVGGDSAYVANGSSGLQVLDITDPDNPTNDGSSSTTGIAVDVAVSGDYIFAAVQDDPVTTETDESGLQIFNISDLSAAGDPFSIPGDPEAVTVRGHYAYVASGVAGLQIIDISSPAEPLRIGFRDTPGKDARAVAISGNYAFVADGDGGLHTIDVSVPSNPIIVDTYTTTPVFTFEDVAITGNYAYVADSSYGIRVIDISFPNSLSEVASTATPGSAKGVALSGNYAFVADGSEGLQVVDITVPTSLARIGAQDVSGNALDIAVIGSSAFVVEGNAGSIKAIDLLPLN